MNTKLFAKLLFIFALVSNVYAIDSDTQEILNILKQANDANAKALNSQQDTTKTLNDMRTAKDLAGLEASNGEFSEEAINKRIEKVIVYFQNKLLLSKREYSIKVYTIFEECNNKSKCTKIAYVKQKDLEKILEELKQQRKDELEENLIVAKGLKDVNPLAVRKQKLEMLENNIYTTKINASTFSTNFQNTNNIESKASTSLKDGEILNGRYKVRLEDNSVIIKEI